MSYKSGLKPVQIWYSMQVMNNIFRPMCLLKCYNLAGQGEVLGRSLFEIVAWGDPSSSGLFCRVLDSLSYLLLVVH